MKVSLAWIQEFTDIDVSVEELADLVNARLVEVEEIIDWGSRYQGVVVAQIMEVAPHDNADKLNIYQINISESDTRQVVSGDKNLKVGDKVGYIPPGATVPSTVATDTPVVIQEVTMRGVRSEGMLGSGRELGLNEDHSGVQVLDTDARPGADFAQTYNLNDIILDIENKSFTHRPDCFGLLGIAREIAAIQSKQFESPNWFKADVIKVEKGSGNLPFEVDNQIPELCQRYTAITIQDVTIGPSSLMMQSMLTRMGIRPINNIVDITNYLMLLTGQPMHAYDYDKVRTLDPIGDGPTISIRFPKEGEKITLLDGRTITPRAEAMMVAAGDNLICVGGAMGGSETEVGEATTNVILECGNWDMYSIRKTSMAHGIFSEAVTRYAKGQSPSLTAPVLGHALGMLIETSANAKIASDLIDLYPDPKQTHEIHCNSGWVNHLLGISLSTDEMAQTLRDIECKVEEKGGELRVTPPLWRSDIKIPEDVADEIGRLRGFDTIEPTMPLRDFTPALPHPMEDLKAVSRNFLSAAGANETLTYSFVSDRLMQQTNQDAEAAYHLANSLSPELAYLRTNILGSLLAKVHMNHKSGFDRFALFEMNKTHQKGKVDDVEGLPHEFQALALVWSAEPKAYNQEKLGAPYYQAKRFLDGLLTKAGVRDLHYRLVRPHTLDSVPEWLRVRVSMFDLDRSAIVMRDEIMLGLVGEPSPSVRRALKLPASVAMFELNLEQVLGVRKERVPYQPLSRFPGVTQDICFKVPIDLLYNDLTMAIADFLQRQESLLFNLSPVDIFQRDNQPEHKQITVRLTLHRYDRTLTTAEVNELVGHLSTRVGSALRAERV